ncbi:MAG: flippase [Candidatus Acidiferrales bacterium]|jgi:O-antigen/teichoic acid export membrane protein
MSRDIANKAVKNFFFSGGRLAISMAATLCTSAIIARKLGPANMGVYGYAMWLVGTLGILANIGLPGALTKYLSEYIGSGDTVTAVQVGKRLLLTQLAVAAGVSGVTACFMLLKSPYRSVIGLAAVMLFAQALQQSLSSALAGLQRFDRLALTSLYVALASVVAVGVAALLHAGVMGMLWATLVGLAVSIWLYYRDVDKFLLKLSPQPSDSVRVAPDPFRRIRRFSLTVSYILLVDAIVWQRSEVLFLKGYSTIAQIAFYTLAYSIASKLGDIASTFSTTLMPLYSESYGRDGLRDIGLVFVNALKYLQMLMVPLCLLGVALARPLAQLIYGSQFLAVALPLQLLLVASAVTSIGVVISPLLYGIDKQSFIAKYGTAVAVLNVALDFVLIPRYGAVGAAVANSTAQIAGVLGGAFYVVRYIRIKFPWKSTIKIYLAAAGAVAPVAYLATRAHLGIAALTGCAVLGGVLYLALLTLVGELGRQDIGVLKTALLTKVYPAKPLRAADPA